MIGRIVLSKAGRDKGRYFLVTGIVDDRTVSIADGDVRKIENSKKKKLIHLAVYGQPDEELIREARETSLTNKRIRALLASRVKLQ